MIRTTGVLPTVPRMLSYLAIFRVRPLCFGSGLKAPPVSEVNRTLFLWAVELQAKLAAGSKAEPVGGWGA